MSGFQFPPPPPPPPPAAAPVPAPFNNRGGMNTRGGGGGGRGHGRGNARGGYVQSYSAVTPQHQQYPNSYAPPNFPQWQNAQYPSQYPQASPGYAAQGYGYAPAFQSTSHYPSTAAPAYTPPAQNFQSTFNSHGYAPTLPQCAAPPSSTFQPFTSPPIRMGFNDGYAPHKHGFHGQKRKRVEGAASSRSRYAQKSQQPRTDNKAAPAVPSFAPSLSLPPRPPSPIQFSGKAKKKSNNSNKKKRRKINQLGLTPRGEDPDDTDEDIDEEARFADLEASSNKAGLIYDHTGSAISLRTPEEIKAWITERKKRYPTQARIAAKATLAALAPKNEPDQPKQESTVEVKSDGTITTKPDLGLHYGTDSDSEVKEEKLTLSDSSQESAADLADPEVSGDERAGPEEQSSRPSDRVNYEASNRDVDKDSGERPFCQSWLRYGSCTWKNCKFKHRQPGVMDPGANQEYALSKQRQRRASLFQTFVEKEHLQREELALRVIKYLGDTGFTDMD